MATNECVIKVEVSDELKSEFDSLKAKIDELLKTQRAIAESWALLQSPDD